MRSGGCSAGSSRALRLDPFALPARFCGERCRRPTSGCGTSSFIVSAWWCGVRSPACAWRSTCRSRTFAGVAIRVLTGEGGATVAVVLEHKDPGAGAAAVCHLRSRRSLRRMARLGQRARPAALVAEDEGGLREAYARMGGVRVERVRPRRRRRSAIRKRRPTMFLRRRPGKVSSETPVHRGEREIIARN